MTDLISTASGENSTSNSGGTDFGLGSSIVAKRLGLVGGVLLFFVCFVFFLYLTFPFGVLKESITAIVNKNTELDLRIGSLSPRIPLGFTANDVVISQNRANSKSVRIQKIKAGLNIFALFTGNLGISLMLADSTGAYLDIDVYLPLRGLIGGQPGLSGLEVDSAGYPVGTIFDFALSMIPLPPEYQGFLGSYLEKIAFNGKLKSNIDLDIDSSDFSRSTGDVEVAMTEASFVIDDPSLALDKQTFSKFLVKAKINKSSLVVDPETAINSQDLNLAVTGNVELKKQLLASVANIQISYQMLGSLKKEIGDLLDTFTGGSGAAAKYELTGPLGQLKTVKQ